MLSFSPAPDGSWSRRSALLLLAIVALALGAGCARIGFDEPRERQISAELGSLRRDAAGDTPLGGPPDVSPPADARVADQRVALLNEVCNPPACGAGLVCSGAFKDRYCRPPCGPGGLCPPDQSCGRPIGAGGVADPRVPRACVSVKAAGRYESCAKLPCKLGLGCVRLDGAVCFTKCLDEKNCAPDESCVGGVPGNRACLPKCGAKDACLPGLACIGNAPIKVCAPVVPVRLGGVCDPRHACAAGLRCVGTSASALRYCHPDCDLKASPTTCAAGKVCVPDDPGAAGACMKACGLFDPTPKCAPTEVCFANPKANKVHCFPGKGMAKDCSAAPCVSGMICVDKVCAKPCDSAHACSGGLTCKTLTFNGNKVPWKACK